MTDIKKPNEWTPVEVARFLTTHELRADGNNNVPEEEVRELMTSCQEFKNDPAVRLVVAQLEKDKPVKSTQPLRQN